jgi:serine/threonine protein kinase
MFGQERPDEYRNVKLCDFGLSHVIDNGTKKAFLEVMCGTHGYTAPE